MGYLKDYFQQIYNYGDRFTNVGYNMIKNELPWLRNLEEDTTQLSHTLPFNTIIEKKLYNLKAIHRYMLKVPYPVIKILTSKENNRIFDTGNMIFFYKMWPEMHKVLINVEGLSQELFSHHMFIDTCKMAASVGEKVNCSWGVKRLVEEHDKWSKEITNVLLLNQKKTPMLIHQVYEEFATYSNLRMLLTNYEMVEDGMIMQHCVATYINKVNQGQCAIYKIDGYTMELKKDSNRNLHIGQIRGVKNADVPEKIYQMVKDLLNDFNENVLSSIEFRAESTTIYQPYLNYYEDLPF
jgi:hypothetical protein